MRFRLLLVLLSYPVYALRDPFSYGTGHKLLCLSVGQVNERHFFARIYKDGLIYTVRLHDRIAYDEVIAFTKSSVTLKDERGICHTLVLAN